MRRPSLALLGALVVYTALRAVILATAFDQTVMAMYELYPMGTVPKLLSVGADFPLRLYYDNAAGQIVTGLMAVPAYALFGETYLALKLVPAALGFATVALVYAVLHESWGRRAATIGAFLFALGPVTTVTKYSLMASGNHFENLFYTSAALLAFHRMHERGVTARRLALTAFACGFAIFVFLGALIPVGLLAGVHLGLRGLRRSARDLAVAAPAFFVGLLPLIVLNLSTGGRAAVFLEYSFANERGHPLPVTFERIGAFLTRDLFAAAGFEDWGPLPAWLPAGAFLAAFLAVWCARLPRATRALARLAGGLGRGQRDEREAFRLARWIPLVAYLPLTAIAYGVSELRNGGLAWPIVVGGYRYFLPHFLFAILLIAAVASEWIEAGGIRRIAGRVLAGAALASGAWNLAYVDLGSTAGGIGTHYVGWNLVQSARGLLAPQNHLSTADVVRIADGLPPVLRRHAYTGIGFVRGGMQFSRRKRFGRPAEAFLDLDRLYEGLPADTRLDVLRGAGRYLGFEAKLRADPVALVRANLEALVAAGRRAEAERVAEGVATPQDFPVSSVYVPRVLARSRRQAVSLAPPLSGALARGIGLCCGRLVARGIPADLHRVHQLLVSLPQPLLVPFARGLGAGLADAREQPRWPAALAERIFLGPHAALLPEVARGLGGGLGHLFGPEGGRRWSERIVPPALAESAREGLHAGP